MTRFGVMKHLRVLEEAGPVRAAAQGSAYLSVTVDDRAEYRRQLAEAGSRIRPTIRTT